MIIISFFTEQGAPKSGLSPTIDIVDIELDSLVVNGASMTALTTMTHGYYYDFTTYDETKKYAITVDGGAALNNLDRYQFATNEGSTIETDIQFLIDVAGGRWKIDETANQMVFYKSDNTTEVARFNLLDINGNATNKNIFERVRA